MGSPLTGHTGSVNSVAFSPNGRLLASGSADDTVRLWDVARRQPLDPPLPGQPQWVGSVAFSPNGKLLASADRAGTILLWEVATGHLLGRPLSAVTDARIGDDLNPAIDSIAFSPDGKLLALGSDSGPIRLWDVATGHPVGPPLTGHLNSAQGVTFSPDGKILASAGGDGTIRLWDVATGQPLGPPLTGHTQYVSSVAFSPDGTILASASGDGSIRLWDVATGQPLGIPLTGSNNGMNSVAFSPSGRLLASGSGESPLPLEVSHSTLSHNNTVQLWDVDPVSLARRACQIANRNLTLQEWRQYLGDLPYQKTCPGVP
jgi:WD40 repeat protein